MQHHFHRSDSLQWLEFVALALLHHQKIYFEYVVAWNNDLNTTQDCKVI